MSIKRKYVKSKISVGYMLENTPDTERYVPETEVLNKKAFMKMIRNHNKVFIKPDNGRKSRGILYIERFANSHFKLRKSYSEEFKEFKSASSLWSEVKKEVKNSKYLIQQGIKSITMDKRPFDLRCHCLRVSGKWRIGGICARLGGLGQIFTTSHQGGTPITIEELFSKHLNYSKEKQELILENLEDCIIKTVNTVSHLYPKNREFAVDIGLDPDGGIWIYEVNIEPLIKGNFKLLSDKTLYKRIKSLREIAS